MIFLHRLWSLPTIYRTQNCKNIRNNFFSFLINDLIRTFRTTNGCTVYRGCFTTLTFYALQWLPFKTNVKVLKPNLNRGGGDSEKWILILKIKSNVSIVYKIGDTHHYISYIKCPLQSLSLSNLIGRSRFFMQRGPCYVNHIFWRCKFSIISSCSE